VRIKIINPNTTAAFTARLERVARAVAATNVEIVAVSPAMGPASIEGHYDEAVSVLGLLDEVRRGEREGFDGYIIACFGDPGLMAAREVARGPVVGIAEAAMHLASLVATGFSIVTTLERSCGITRRLVENYGMTRVCRSVRATDLAVLDLERPGFDARRAVVAECLRAVAEDRAEAIVLGCAGMADLAIDIAREIDAPVIEGVTAAVKLLEALLSLDIRTSKRGDLAYPLAKPYHGIMATFAPDGGQRGATRTPARPPDTRSSVPADASERRHKKTRTSARRALR
jgi:allantoin racemase